MRGSSSMANAVIPALGVGLDLGTSAANGCSRPINTAPRFSGPARRSPPPRRSAGAAPSGRCRRRRAPPPRPARSTLPPRHRLASVKHAPSPAPLSATTSSPMPTMRLTVSGEAATRRSNARLSLTMATFIERLFPDGRADKTARTMPRLPEFVKSEPVAQGLEQRPRIISIWPFLTAVIASRCRYGVIPEPIRHSGARLGDRCTIDAPTTGRKALPGINIQEVRCHLVRNWRDRRYAWFQAEIR